MSTRCAWIGSAFNLCMRLSLVVIHEYGVYRLLQKWALRSFYRREARGGRVGARGGTIKATRAARVRGGGCSASGVAGVGGGWCSRGGAGGRPGVDEAEVVGVAGVRGEGAAGQHVRCTRTKKNYIVRKAFLF